ncbi:EamA family transporter [Candidatus Accumulibacter phosphatis]|nr:EamA family transporter [Candidatus Accumulibacter phosphatis]
MKHMERMRMQPRFDVAGHCYIALTLFFTVYGQLVLKWQMSGVGPLPDGATSKLWFLLQQFLNPWIMTGLASAFLASLAWMAAMTRFDLNYAYPFMSLAFVIVMGFSVLFLNEPITVQRLLGTLMVVGGLIVMSR